MASLLRSDEPSRGHVFLVDDHHELRSNLSELLRMSGYTVEEFDNADAFLQHHGYPMPAVVLADMHMLGKSGLQMQAQLQSLEPRLPLVFISGGVSAAEMEQAMQQGAVGFLLKPFTRKELCEVLDRALMPPLA